MKDKEYKKMAVKEDYLTFVMDQLSAIDNVTTKRMFGGVGLFRNSLMFAKIGGGKFYLKVDDHNKSEFEARGMKAFYSEKKRKGMPYWAVPVDILEDKDELTKWAMKSYEAAERAKK
jgi:DNA transformation protein